MTNRYEKFSLWLKAELAERGWKQADLVRAAGIDSGYLSKIIRLEKPVSIEVSKAIARALEIPETEVLIQAGLMSRPPGYNAEVEELVSLIMTLPPDDREEIFMLARQKIHRHRRGNPNAAKSSG